MLCKRAVVKKDPHPPRIKSIPRCHPHNQKKKSALQTVLSRMQQLALHMQLAEHLTFRFALLYASIVCLVGENPTCSVPALQYARVYDHTTTAMHDVSTLRPLQLVQYDCFQTSLHNMDQPALFSRQWIIFGTVPDLRLSLPFFFPFVFCRAAFG